MKKNVLILSSLILSWVNLAFAQESQSTIFKYQDSVNNQLFKYGIPMLDYPPLDIAPCQRSGSPSLTVTSRFDPNYEQVNPVVGISGDTTTTIDPINADKEINIYWIHGLNGTTETWKVAAKCTSVGSDDNTFPARKVFSVMGSGVQTYHETDGVSIAVSDLKALALKDPTFHTDKDYIIAHSQGGIVSRDWLRKIEQHPSSYDNHVHGLVTFGTPHAGALILNNTRSDMKNKLPGFFNEACTSLGDALVTPAINSNFWTNLLISDNMKNKIINNSCDVLSNSIIPSAFDNYENATTLDYYVGSPFLTGYESSTGHIQGLSEYVLKVPVVQFYGVEEQPILWRFMSSTMNMGEAHLGHNSEREFGFTKDDQLMDKVNNLVNDFEAKYQYEKDQEEYYQKGKNISAVFSWLILPAASYFYYMSMITDAQENQDAYFNAKVWLSNANDYYLTDIVGARVNTISLECHIIDNLDCRDLRYNPVNSGVPPVKINMDRKYISSANACTELSGPITITDYHFLGHNGSEWHGPCSGTQTVISTWVNTYYYKDNDGVVLAESGSADIPVDMNLPNVVHNRIPLPLTNHDQMKNSTITKNVLSSLYDGYYGRFFKVGKR